MVYEIDKNQAQEILNFFAEKIGNHTSDNVKCIRLEYSSRWEKTHLIVFYKSDDIFDCPFNSYDISDVDTTELLKGKETWYNEYGNYAYKFDIN